jgi:hypothetical protein
MSIRASPLSSTFEQPHGHVGHLLAIQDLLQMLAVRLTPGAHVQKIDRSPTSGSSGVEQVRVPARPRGSLGNARYSASACDPHGKQIRDVLDQLGPRPEARLFHWITNKLHWITNKLLQLINLK